MNQYQPTNMNLPQTVVNAVSSNDVHHDNSPLIQSLTQNILNNVSLPETIKQLENQISLFGPGPHTPNQKVELNKLVVFLLKAKMDLQKQQVMTIKQTQPNNDATTTDMSAAMSSPSTTNKPNSNSGGPATNEARVLDKRRLQELVKEVDPMEQMEDDVEEVLLQIADDFIEGVVTNACHLARHRKSNTLEVKDVKLHLERNWNMMIPGFGSDEVRGYKKACQTEAHKQRMSLIRKTLKKY